MRILRFISLFLLAAILVSPLSGVRASALSDPSPGAEFVVLVETTSNQVLYAKNENARAYPASLTKIMTVMLACESIASGEVSASDMVTASGNIRFDLTDDSSTANIVPGETMSLESLMYCALVKSANEACNIIAEYLSGSVSTFVQRMNDRAQALGCTGTRFANTHGMPDEGHYTTAWDMYLILSEAMQHSLFLDISNTKSIQLLPTNVSTPRILENTNALLGDSEFYKGYAYEYAKGGKTGHTSAAGYCLASNAIKNDIELIAVVMHAQLIERDDGSQNFGHFSDSILLYNWAFENFSYQDIIKQTEIIATLPVEMGSDTDTVSLRPERSLSALLPNDIDPVTSFKREVTLYNEDSGESLMAPINAGAVLGEITLLKDGANYGTLQLVATGDVELSKTYYMISQIKETLSSSLVRNILIFLVLLFLAYIVILIRYRVLRIRHRMSVRKARKERSASESAGYSANEYYSQSSTAPRRAAARVDHFDEDDYYENEPIGRTSYTPPAPQQPLDSEDGGQSYDEYPEPDAQEDDGTQADRDFYKDFFK